MTEEEFDHGYTIEDHDQYCQQLDEELPSPIFLKNGVVRSLVVNGTMNESQKKIQRALSDDLYRRWRRTFCCDSFRKDFEEYDIKNPQVPMETVVFI